MSKRLKIWFSLIASFLWLLSFNVIAIQASESFFIDPGYDNATRQEAEAELIEESDVAYLYIDKEYFDNFNKKDQIKIETKLTELGENFDTEIYPKVTALFGDVWNPGIDDDPKITVLFTTMIEQAGGYIRTEDEMSHEKNSLSNEREMIYLNTSYLFDHRLKSYLAHELQHLITYNQKERIHGVEDDVWINEMRSEYVPTYLGYDAENYEASNLKKRVDKFSQHSSDSLTEWQRRIYDYPGINLFAQYLADHYGEDFFRHLIVSEKTGIASINDTFEKLGFQKDFADLFGDWLVALYLNDTQEDIRYGYLNPLLKDLKANPTAIYNVLGNATLERSGLMKEWTPFWYEINTRDGSDNETVISFEGEAERGSFKAKILKVDSRGDNFISDWDIGNEEGKLTIQHLGSGLQKIVLMPYLTYNGSYGSEDLDYANFSFTVKAEPEDGSDQNNEEGTVELSQGDSQVTHFSNLQDGDLVRAQGDFRVYIIQGNYKRHIKSGEIFNFYGHLNWQNIQEVSSYELSLYMESNLVRAQGDKKVYKIDEDGNKHWLNVSGYEFVNQGNSWDSVYVINQQERDFYTEQESITSL